jgi:hypothetical protein
MSIRHTYYLLVFALLSVSNVGCCGYMGGCGTGLGGQMYGAGCASCGCPEASCCCEDTCCEAACGCSDVCCEPACGCDDVCCDASCGCSDGFCEASCGCNDVCCDVGCGSAVAGPCPIFGRCLIFQRLRTAFNNCYGCYGGCDGCSSQGYLNEWQDSPPCNCQSAATGGHYGGAYGRRAFLAKQHEQLSDELRFADEGSGPILR